MCEQVMMVGGIVVSPDAAKPVSLVFPILEFGASFSNHAPLNGYVFITI